MAAPLRTLLGYGLLAVAAATGLPPRAAADLAAAAWAAAFVLFLWAYAPVLTAPRAGTGA
jgi:uncharacterized protein involved in response to NO